MTATLEQEQRFFDDHRDQWVRDGHEGEWAVVKCDELIGFYQTLDEGFEVGVERFGAGNFLVKEVSSEDQADVIQRVDWGPFPSVETIS